MMSCGVRTGGVGTSIQEHKSVFFLSNFPVALLPYIQCMLVCFVKSGRKKMSAWCNMFWQTFSPEATYANIPSILSNKYTWLMSTNLFMLMGLTC